MKKDVLNVSKKVLIDNMKKIVKNKIKNTEIYNFIISSIDSINIKNCTITDVEFKINGGNKDFSIIFHPNLKKTKQIVIKYNDEKSYSRSIHILTMREGHIIVNDEFIWDNGKNTRSTHEEYYENKLGRVISKEVNLDDNGEVVIEKQFSQYISKDGEYVISYVGSDKTLEEPRIERYYQGKEQYPKLYNNKRRKVVSSLRVEDVMEKSKQSNSDVYNIVASKTLKIKK